MLRFRAVGLGTALILLAATNLRGADTPTAGKNRPANRLNRETSPYLLMHAHNPVDWYPWGPEAFVKAKKENKLVFLSIGYSSCYWCHVMERESFENEDVAKLLNQWFVCIKVDREERPDIDSIYMTALNVTGQRGGWPLSMFLTSDGKPILGGTYWPREDREIEGEKVRGFKSILKLVHDWHAEKGKELTEQADRVAARTAEVLAGQARGVALVDLDRRLVSGAVDALKEECDLVHGGFGNPAANFRGTKFPVPPYLKLLLHEARRTKSGELTNVLTLTLDHMARGGIYDQLGGGFHRYSTERTWTVPHFEKMLYDNAQLAEVYAQTYALTKNPLYERVVRETLAFVLREMTSPEGAFFSALDAETGGEEGRFYVWTDKEIADVLQDKAAIDLVKKVYGAAEVPNFESKYHIFVLPKPLADTARDLKLTGKELEERLAPLRRKLFEARAKRPRPFLDTKVLTSWNGQMIAGFAVAGQVFKDSSYVDVAVRAAEFVLGNLRTKEGRLLRTYGAQPGKVGEARLNGYLDDYAYLVHGLLCLHEATGDARWLKESQALTDTMVQFHGDKDHGGFFYTSNDHEKLFARAKDQYDSVQPSGNSAAAGNLVRLWLRTRDDRYRALAERSFKAFAGPMKADPTRLTAMADALALFLDAQEKRKPVELGKKEPGGGAKKSDSVVHIKVKGGAPDANGNQQVTVTITVDEGWHLYANPVPKDFPGIPVMVTADAKVKPQSVTARYPDGKLVKDDLAGDHRIYEKEVVIPVTVVRAKGDTSPLQVTVKIQACNEDKCLLPGVIKVTVP